MKKILIVNNNLFIGGVQKALVNLLWNIRDQYDVTLLLFHPGGEYCKEIPPEIKVVTVKSGYRYLGMSRQDAVARRDRWMRFFFAGISRMFGRKYAIALMGICQKSLGEYDVAISYLHNAADGVFNGGCNDFVLNHVSAKKKIAFLHCDYSLCGANTPDNNRQYGRFDVIAACSQGCADAFQKVNPQLAHKVMVVLNCHRYDRIRAMAEEAPVFMDPCKINLVTVSRFGKEKSVDRALEAIAGLGGLKDRIHYYIVGDGVQKPKLLEILEREQLQGCVTLCGQLDKPYGYMQAADLLLIPSRSEAAPLVIGEAACLGTPILSTKTSSALEMIEEPGYGWVCDNSVSAMTDMLTLLVCNPDMLDEMSQRLKRHSFQNDFAIAQFIKCME